MQVWHSREGLNTVRLTAHQETRRWVQQGFLVAQPGRAKDKSPAFQRWEQTLPLSSPLRDDRST